MTELTSTCASNVHGSAFRSSSPSIGWAPLALARMAVQRLRRPDHSSPSVVTDKALAIPHAVNEHLGLDEDWSAPLPVDRIKLLL